MGTPGRTINRVPHTTINVIGNTARAGGDGQRVGPSSNPPHRHRAQPKWPKSLVRTGYPMSLGSPHERVNFLQLCQEGASVAGVEPLPSGLQGLGRHPRGARAEDDRHHLREPTTGCEQ